MEEKIDMIKVKDFFFSIIELQVIDKRIFMTQQFEPTNILFKFHRSIHKVAITPLLKRFHLGNEVQANHIKLTLPLQIYI